MTTIADFDIATDLKVEFFLPGGGDNNFIIGISLIGGENVLAGEGLFYIGTSLIGGDDVLGDAADYFGFTWQDLSCTASQLQLQVGGSIQDQTYFQPEPAKANIRLQTYDYDPNVNPAFRPGTQVRVRLDDGIVDQIIWQGIIDTIGGSYTIEGKNLLNIVAYDSFKQLVNTRIDLFDTETDFPAGWVTPYEQLEIIAEQFGTTMHEDSVDNGGEIPSDLQTDIIPTSKVNEAIQVGLGIFWIDPATKEFVFIPRPESGEVPEGTYPKELFE